MKFSLIAAVVVLALAQGSFAQDAIDLDSLSQYFDNIRGQVNEMMQTQDLAAKTQTFLEAKKTELEPMLAQFQEQMKSAATNIEGHIQPLTENLQAKAKPLLDQFQKQLEDLFAKVSEHTKALGN